jgi:hypothetical protein
MFVQSKTTIHPKHKNGLAIRSRRAGKEILIQWSNGDQRWCPSEDIAGSIRFVELETAGVYDND